MARSFRIALLLAVSAWALVFFWLGARSDPFWQGYSFQGRQSDYYNLLVEGFQHGHLSMNATVSPELLSENPVVRAHAPYLLDAALYQGKYYLYYGVTPAVLVLLPYAALTGNEMGLEVACLAFAVAGLAVGACWLDAVRRWLRADWGPGFALVGVSLIAVVPGLPFLVRRSSFYELAIVSGAAFALGYWYALFRAWTSDRPGRWLAVASTCLGFAVGSRPTLLLASPLLLAFAFLIGRRDGRSLLRDLFLALFPAAILGAGLAWYNFARFGNPLDFGVAHDLNVFFSTGNPLLAWRFLPANLRWYFLTHPAVAPWFPFDYPIQNLGMPVAYTDAEDINGFLPISFLCAGSAVVWLFGRRNQPASRTKPFAVSVWIGAGAVGLFTCLLGVRAYRYATDFMTPAALGLVLLVGSVWIRQGRGSRLTRAAMTLFSSIAVIHAVLGSIQLFDGFKSDRPREFAFWSRHLNPPQRTLKWLGAERSGAVTLTIRFHAPAVAQVVPLVTTGLPNAYDRLQAIVYPNGYVGLQIFHFDYGGPRSELIPIDWNRPYHLEAMMGSLYPDAADETFSTWQRPDVRRAKTMGWVSWEGRTVIKRAMSFFPGTPRFHSTGSAGIGEISPSAARAVSIDSARQGADFPLAVLAAAPTSPAIYRMTVRLASGAVGKRLPLLCSGTTGEGDLLLLDPLPNGRYRLVIDQWGSSPLIGPGFSLSAAQPASFEILVGPALRTEPVARTDLGNAQADLFTRLLVWKDGTPIGNFRLTRHLESFDQILIGRNEAGFTSAEADFDGTFDMAPSDPQKEKDLLRKASATRPPESAVRTDDLGL